MRAGAWGAAALAAVLMTGCGPQNPSDKVVATVMGEKITAGQVDIELRAARVTRTEDPTLRRAMLEQIVARKLMARAARAEGLDRQPEVLRAKALAGEAFDANLYRLAVVNGIAAPTPAEAAAYVAAHPEKFARRTVYVLDELRAPVRPSKELVDALMPAKSLAEAQAVFNARKVPYVRAPDSVDTLRAAPDLIAAIAALPMGEAFLLPSGDGMIVGAVASTRTIPIAGPQATKVATELLLAERRAAAARSSMATLRKDTVTYADGYAPKPAAK